MIDISGCHHNRQVDKTCYNGSWNNHKQESLNGGTFYWWEKPCCIALSHCVILTLQCSQNVLWNSTISLIKPKESWKKSPNLSPMDLGKGETLCTEGAVCKRRLFHFRFGCSTNECLHSNMYLGYFARALVSWRCSVVCCIISFIKGLVLNCDFLSIAVEDP